MLQQSAQQCLAEQIADRIAQQIITGELLEGERIPELRIAKEMQVSRGSVREALLLLQRTHLIEIYPRRGAIVTEMSVEQVNQLFESCDMLLSQLIQCFIYQHASSEKQKFEQLELQLALHVKQMQSEQFYDLWFYFLLNHVAQFHNLYFAQFFQDLFPALRRCYFLILNTSRRDLEETFNRIKWMIDAILTQNLQQATLFMHDFCRHLRGLVLDSLTRMKQIELAWARRSRH